MQLIATIETKDENIIFSLIREGYTVKSFYDKNGYKTFIEIYKEDDDVDWIK